MNTERTMNKENIEQFDFITEKDKLQSEIKDKLLVFLSKCGDSKVQFSINPKYASGVGSRNFRMK